MNSKQVIIFARAPRLGVGKRRLARDVGDRVAYDFYEANLRRLILALSCGDWQLHISVVSESEQHHPLFENLSTTVQPEGDIGQRMFAVLAHFSGSHRVIVGSDIPALDRAHVIRAFNSLDTHQLVFGPAEDGGFWGVGCSQGYLPNSDFMRGVRWSSSYTLADTIATVPTDTSVAQVDCLTDVDDGESYARFVQAK